jgi:hypothetical protein
MRLRFVLEPLASLLLASAMGTGALLADAPGREAPRAGELALRFSAADDGVVTDGAAGSDARLELGSVSALRSGFRASAQVVIRRRVAVTLVGGAGAPAFARLQLFLHADDGRVRVRVDGIRLSTVPRMVEPHARVGSPSIHLIELEVPDSSAPGALLSAIGWLVETE